MQGALIRCVGLGHVSELLGMKKDVGNRSVICEKVGCICQV
jgi:hypothetical protein